MKGKGYPAMLGVVFLLRVVPYELFFFLSVFCSYTIPYAYGIEGNHVLDEVTVMVVCPLLPFDLTELILAYTHS